VSNTPRNRHEMAAIARILMDSKEARNEGDMSRKVDRKKDGQKEGRRERIQEERRRGGRK